MDLTFGQEAILLMQSRPLVIPPDLPAEYGGGTQPVLSVWFASKMDNDNTDRFNAPNPEWNYTFYIGKMKHKKAELSAMVIHGGPIKRQMAKMEMLTNLVVPSGGFVPIAPIIPLTAMFKAPATMYINYNHEYGSKPTDHTFSGFIYVCVANDFKAASIS